MNETLSTTTIPRGVRQIYLMLFVILVVAVIVTTVTHHAWPQLTGVPAQAVDIWILVPTDIMVTIMGFVTFKHAQRTLGKDKAWFFLLSSILFAGIEETFWILTGRSGVVPPTYYFTYGGLWFFEIPIYTCVAWFMVCYCGYTMVKKTFPAMRSAGIAALVGAFGTCWDLWLDPVVCNRHLVSSLPDLWIWLNPTGIRLFDIPILNFAGWFGVIFTVVFVFDRCLQSKDPLTPRTVGTFYLFLAIGWGIIFALLHLVGLFEVTANFAMLPVYFGTAIDPVASGARIFSTLGTTVYLLGLVMASIVLVVYNRKSKPKILMHWTPVLVIGFWLMAVLGTAFDMLATFPATNIGWIMICCSAYPIALMLLHGFRGPRST
jgi:hypothetical protein